MKFVFLLLIFISCSASAGGAAGIKAKKVSLVQDAFISYTLKLRIYQNDLDDWYTDCKVLTIKGTYNFWRWKVQRRTKPTYQEYKVALNAIKNTNNFVFINGVGNVFRKTSKKCHVESEGLDLETSLKDNSIVINSYYNYHP